MALPLMGIAFIQMAYNLVDLAWIGRLSTDAVAAVGTAGFFMWIANAVTLIIKTGVSVELAQAYGKQNVERIKAITIAGLQLTLVLWAMLSCIYIVFRRDIYGYFRLEPSVFELALDYHTVISGGLIFTFLMPYFSAYYYGEGNSETPFRTFIVALLFNLIMDPIFIFGLGPIPKMGIKGAALATVLAQALGVCIYLFLGYRHGEVYTEVNYVREIRGKNISEILKLGLPACGQSLVHSLVSVRLNKFIAVYKAVGIATYTIGSQIESISWMSAEGFATAFTAFFGQNYGAGNYERLEEGKRVCTKLILAIGIVATAVLCLGSGFLFKLFTPNDPRVVEEGRVYLLILGSTTILMAMEIGYSGMLNGLGLTRYPAFISTVFNVLRIPMAYVLMKIFALRGIWLAMTISQAVKGIFMVAVFSYIQGKTGGFRLGMERYRKKARQS
ncbi:MAG: MATE family efflux transporter [Peptoniphilus sp.]|nr:MATE family efflux transporter [Bacillota bacterium]MDY6044581.1 MATE family efflux transporter [Peptoniphilus sp.]